MTTNLAKWAPNNGQIIKSGLSDGRRAKFLPSVAGYDYYWLRTGGYLGNVGLIKLSKPEKSGKSRRPGHIVDKTGFRIGRIFRPHQHIRVQYTKNSL